MAIISLHNIDAEQKRVVDGKIIALSKLSQKFHIPQGFVVTSEVFEYFLKHTGLKNRVQNLTGVINPGNDEKLQNIANEIQKLIVRGQLPEDVKAALTEAYQSIELDEASPVEDLMETKEPLVELEASPVNYLDEGISMYNVSNSERFIEGFLSCYGLHYSASAIKKRLQHGLEDRGVSVAVKKTLSPQISGKVKLSGNIIIVEAVFGYYADEVKEEADVYKIDKESFEVLERKSRGQKSIAKVSDGRVYVEANFTDKPKLDASLEDLGKAFSEVFNFLEDGFNEFEFSIVDKQLYINKVNYEEKEEEFYTDESFYQEAEYEQAEQPEEEMNIFSAFKNQPENPYYSREEPGEVSLESARHALGHAVIECELMLIKKLADSYREIFREEPSTSLLGMADAISEYKTVPLLDDLKKISEISRRFTREGRPPNTLEVKFVFEKSQAFIDQFQ
ncbi:MAG: PEP/pyruvate-binding domain-containing protein [Candidatus Nanoarchaeia archaeon]